MSRLVHLIADYGAGDPALAEVVGRLSLALPDAVIEITPVPPGDTLSAGFCAAQLAHAGGSPWHLVAHDVGARDDAPSEPGPWPPGAGLRFCVGRSRTGTLVVGANTGWSWSFVARDLWGLCCMDVPAGGASRRHAERLPAAVAHAMAHHPHAVADVVARADVPPVPKHAIAHVDVHGTLKTTITRLPAASGTRIVVRIGDVSETAIVSDGTVAVPDGELALAPASSEWAGDDDERGTSGEGRERYLELFLRGGSAAHRFAAPPTGSSISVAPAEPSEVSG
ncbi:MAG: hypothetical protein QOG70_646 [Solirubrobacteraceae bacterium]|jgi:hypothetical protein|nr:hypothetical protein [Solirubrobacteraceae bacterium]